MTISIYDNFLGNTDRQKIFKMCHEIYYKMGETDRPDCPPTGMVSVLDKMKTDRKKEIFLAAENFINANTE